MFMAKNELSNAVILAKVQIKNDKLSTVVFGIALLITLLAGLIPAIVTALSPYEDHITYSAISDNFFIPVLVIGFGVTVINFMYRSYNSNYAVYPQTNNSRFLANQIVIYTFIILIALAIMLIYLIQYGVISLIAHGRDNVRLVLDFNIAFVLRGLVVAIIYLALIAGTITLIFTLLRKFRLYAVVFFTVLATVLLGSLADPLHLLHRLLSFLLEEPNIWLFILKGVGIWAVLFIAAFLVNKYTVYYKAHSLKFNKKVMGGICAITIFAAFIVISLLTGMMTFAEPIDIPTPWDVLWDERSNILEFDLSDVPAGSDINVVTSGDVTFIDDMDSVLIGWSHSLPPDGQTVLHFHDGSYLTFPFGHLTIVAGEQLLDVDGGTLFVNYYYPIQMIESGGSINHLMNPEFDIRFEGDTLYINYTYDRNVKAIVIPVWSFMRQFSSFRGQNVFNEMLIHSAWEDVRLWLWVE